MTLYKHHVATVQRETTLAEKYTRRFVPLGRHLNGSGNKLSRTSLSFMCSAPIGSKDKSSATALLPLEILIISTNSILNTLGHPRLILLHF